MALDETSRMPGQDQILSVGERLAQALKCLSAHDRDVAHGHFLKPLEILRKVPWDRRPCPDNTIERHRGNGFEWFHSIDQTRAGRSEVAAAFFK